MSAREVLAIWVMVALVSACSTPPQLVVSGRETCTYDGPSALDAGVYEFVVLGDTQMDLYSLSTGVRYEDIVEHYESGDGRRHAPGATMVFDLVNVPGLNYDRSTRNATSGSYELRAGEYAVVCQWRAGEFGGRRAVSGLTVSD